MSRDRSAWAELRDEVRRADKRYGPFLSTHEGYGVLAEEMLELLQAIQSNVKNDIDEEAMQVAAVAMRLVHVCRMRGKAATEFAARSGFGGSHD